MDNKLLKTLVIGSILIISISAKSDDDRTWWKTSNYYQIYPKSFQDSDGDGIGDLNGITSRLSYLKEIGIRATWLSPIFESPMVDNGYDISNFRKIDPVFGNITDFKKLIKRAKELDIKIILDFVPNHSSDKHEWFEKSINKIEGYEDYYVWADGVPDKNNKNKLNPPNNWVSVFRGSAWTWNEKREQFYLHQFYKEQPDLNFRSQKVKEEMKEILIYWLDQGVDGFRIDAVPHIIEDKDLKDEPRNPNVEDPNEYGSLIHDYTYDQDETFEMIYEWRKVLDDYTTKKGGPDRILLAEAYSPMDKKLKYYGTKDKKGAQFPFNFFLLDLHDKSNAKEYVAKVKEWMDKMPKTETANWVFGNHDKPRIANRLGRERTTLANLFILSMPGITVTYYGEEIGMENIEIKKPTPFYMEDDRNGERSPMQWNDEIAAGFSTNASTWLPVAPDFKYRNVKMQRRIPLGHLNQFIKMTELREKFNFYDQSNFEIESLSDSVIHITRTYKDYKIHSLFNVGEQKDEIKVIKDKAQMEVLFLNENSMKNIGDNVNTDALILLPNEVLILKHTTKF